VPHFNALAEGDPLRIYGINFISSETRVIVLPDAEDRTIVCLFVWTKHWNVTDGQTDGQSDSP